MRKLRYALVLPVAQVILAVVLLALGHAAYKPRGLDTAYLPTATLICRGINAPALVFKMVGIVQMLPIWRDKTPTPVLGFDSSEILFLAGVAVVWYIVGLALDRRSAHRTDERARMSIGKQVSLLLLFMLGIWILFGGAIQSFRDPGLYNNPFGNLMQAVLFLLWSIVLIVLPGLELLNTIRRKLADSRAA